MPKNACERGIYHVMEYAFFSKCPKIEDVHFRFIFCFSIEYVFFFEMPHFSMLNFFEMPHFPIRFWKFRTEIMESPLLITYEVISTWNNRSGIIIRFSVHVMCPSWRSGSCWPLAKRMIWFIWWARSWMNRSLVPNWWSNTTAIWSVRWRRIHSVWIHMNLTIRRWLSSRWSTWSLARGHWIGRNLARQARWNSRGTWWIFWKTSSDITGIEGCVFHCDYTFYFRTFIFTTWDSFDNRWWCREIILVVAQNYYYMESSSNIQANIIICVVLWVRMWCY